MRLGVLVSGSGSNLQAMIDCVAAGTLDARIALVISNKPGVLALERAHRAGIPTACVLSKDFSERTLFDLQLVHLLQEAEVDWVALAGFMRILTPAFLTPFAGRVLNIHPSLLPACPGLDAQGQQVRYGVRMAGCSVHFVDEKLDHGPVIIQAAVPAFPDDDALALGARILQLEHRIYPQALQWIATGRVRLVGRQAYVDGVRQDFSSSLWTNPPLEPPFDG